MAFVLKAAIKLRKDTSVKTASHHPRKIVKSRLSRARKARARLRQQQRARMLSVVRNK